MTPPVTRDELLPLGAAPRPTSGAEVAERVLAVLRDAAGRDASGLERARVDATLDGADVAALAVDVSGLAVRVTSRRGGGPSTHDALHAEDGDPREPATLRSLRLDAHPVVVEDVPVDVAAVAEGLRFAWVETSDGRLGVEPVEPDDAHPVTGHVRVAVPEDAVVATARRLLTAELATQGLTLTSLDVEITSRGPRSVAVRAFARVRKAILSASIHATLVADVDERMVLRVREVDLSSRNPVVAALLVAGRRHVDEVRGRSVDLAGELPAGVRLGDVRLDVGADGTVALTARFV